MTQFNAWPLGGGVWVGPVRKPRNSAANEKGSIHDDAVAQKLGFRGGTVAASLHMEQFPPLLLHMFGPRWWECGRPVAVLPLRNHRPRSRSVSRGGADATADAKTSASKCGWSIRNPVAAVRSGSPTARRPSVVPTSARHCDSAFSWFRNRANCGSSRSCRPDACCDGVPTRISQSALDERLSRHHRTTR